MGFRTWGSNPAGSGSGTGVPPGGTIGQLLTKLSNADGDGGWADPPVSASVWRDGAGAPSNALGADGDYYLNTTNGDVYEKDAGSYSVVGNIKGADGADGADGAPGSDGAPGAPGADGAPGMDGADGTSIRSGVGAPSNGLGMDGDLYVNTTNGDLHEKAAGTYSIVGNIKGADGADGADGAPGPQGDPGPSSLQAAYDGSTTNPEILTDGTRGALQIRRGSASDTDSVLEVQTNAGTALFIVRGNGTIVTASAGAASGLATLGAASRLVEAVEKLYETGGATLTLDGIGDNTLLRRDGTLCKGSRITEDDNGRVDTSCTNGDTAYAFSVSTTGSNGSTVRTFVGTRNPEGLVTGNPGDIYNRTGSGTSSTVYVYRGASAGTTGWIELGVGLRRLHVAQRTATVLNVSSRTTIAYDSDLKPANSSYLSYASGVWTVLQACSLEIAAELSFARNAVSVDPVVTLGVYRGSGGTQNTLVQDQQESVYATTNPTGNITVTGYYTFSASDQFRVAVEATAGVDLIANRNVVRVTLDL